jgi:hypothetical protein
MANPNHKPEQSSTDQPPAAETQPRPDERLKFAREKLEHMESTQKLCFKHQNDLATLEAELKALDYYNDYEITQILEPKGPRNIPGYLKSEIERQKQYVNYLTARVKPADSHAAGVEQRQQEDELAR